MEAPQPAGSGVVYATRIVGGSVPRNFWPAVEKGVRETALRGVIAGYPLSDFKATMYDGSFHTVDSNELSFHIAASMALKEGVLQAKPVLLINLFGASVGGPVKKNKAFFFLNYEGRRDASATSITRRLP